MDNISYNISIASDHRGFDVKNEVIKLLEKLGHKVFDLGPETNESVDYPDYAHKLSEHIAEDLSQFGILVCGTGIGMSIAANRNSHIRAALCLNDNMAKLSRAHNNANVLVVGSILSPAEEIKSIIKTFLITDFEGGRHIKRLSKIR